MNCDRIARWYALLEYLSFGTALWRRRCEFLDRILQARRALLLGEGDGRFLRCFVQRNPQATVDYLDCSTGMTRVARQRTFVHNMAPNRVKFFTADVHSHCLPRQTYDLICSHFFLDCFTSSDLAAIVRDIACSATDDAIWIVSEFRIAGRGWRGWRSRLWVKLLYWIFHWTTGLEVRELPDYRALLRRCEFRLISARGSSAGLLVSELWQRVRNSGRGGGI